MHVVYPAVLAALLFSVGVYGVLARRNTILVLMSVELMMGAAGINLVTFDLWLGDAVHAGQVMTLFVIVIAAAEVGVGLAIVLLAFRHHKTIALDRLRALSETTPQTAPMAAPAPRPEHAGVAPRPEHAGVAPRSEHAGAAPR